MSEAIEIMRAEAATCRLCLAFEADDIDSYAVALAEVLSDAQLTASVLATAIHTLVVCMDRHPGWVGRTQAQLAATLDALAGV